LRGDLEALRPRGFGVVYLTSRRDPYGEETILSKLSRHETAIRAGLEIP
jgi:hypothetical protein